MKQIKFGDKNSYDAFGLRLLEYTIDPPEVKKLFVELPGGDGVLDLTEWTGYPVYSNRKASFNFDLQAGNMVEMEEKLSQLYAGLNGIEKKVYIGDGYYYTGRLTITTEPINNLFRMVSIAGDFYPYKFKDHETIVNVNAAASGTSVTLNNTLMPVVPKITAENSVQIQYGGNNYVLAAGEQFVPGIMLFKGQHDLVVKGTGQVTFTYREGRF